MERRSKDSEGEVFQEGEAGEAEGEGRGAPSEAKKPPAGAEMSRKLSAVSHGGGCVSV